MKKPVFVLRNIDVNILDVRYNVASLVKEESSQQEDMLHQQQLQKTKITDITDKDDSNFFSFLDESKKDHQCVFTMRSYLNQELLPETTSLHCFWCRHSFQYRPIGCPIEYVPPRVSKSYHSEITKDRYVLRENITPQQVRMLEVHQKRQQESQKGAMDASAESDPDSTNPSNTTNTTSTITDAESNIQYSMVDNDYYLMDGLFCSFNCCLAYIKMNQNNPLYANCEALLNRIYYVVFGPRSLPLIEAPSWRLLKNYGGHVSIEDYRKNFYKVEYLSADNVIYPFPKSKCIGFLFERNIKL